MEKSKAQARKHEPEWFKSIQEKYGAHFWHSLSWTYLIIIHSLLGRDLAYTCVGRFLRYRSAFCFFNLHIPSIVITRLLLRCSVCLRSFGRREGYSGYVVILSLLAEVFVVNEQRVIAQAQLYIRRFSMNRISGTSKASVPYPNAIM